ncbi:MAG: hypothetical protein XD78_1987 [Desulfotomaculum sp. 46_296]|nr:MAG: hypothetical protein XD78_1987 [Desulfotomaculum sp. 46_296]HAG08588.1 hypothetical protein [Desulfotomaculum sp.]HAU31631.1 hypothetical protein [Desulfotomaculum sp.]
MRPKLLYIFFIIIPLFIAGCNISNDHSSEKNKQAVSDKEEAKQTVIRYLKALNDNDYDEQLQYLSTRKRGEFEQDWVKRKEQNCMVKYEYVKIINITPDESEKTKVGYMKHGGGQLTKPVDFASFDVDFEYKIIHPEVDKKKLNYSFDLIKEKENEPWKIDDWGISWDNVPPPD